MENRIISRIGNAEIEMTKDYIKSTVDNIKVDERLINEAKIEELQKDKATFEVQVQKQPKKIKSEDLNLDNCQDDLSDSNMLSNLLIALENEIKSLKVRVSKIEKY